MNAKERFLIIAPSWIGDLLMSQSVFKFLKHKYHNCTIDVIARPYLSDLLKLMPEINNVHDLDIQHNELGITKRSKISMQLKKHNYSSAIILTNTFKSALVPWIMRIPERIGYKRELRSILLTKSFKLIKHKDSMVNRYLKLVGTTFNNNLRPSLRISSDQAEESKNKFLLNNMKKNIFLCPEAEFGITKRWPKNNWIELAKRFKQNNYNVYFLGKDITSARVFEPVVNNSSIISLIGKTNLKEVTYLLSSANLVVANDSGLMHLAASLDVNLISIFGSSSPFYTPPLMKNNNGEVIYKQLDCSPCFKNSCPLNEDDNLKCLKSITVDEISKKAQPYLD
tara:strand:- start:803 stop:1819 length:1017 start_codon:yes stop_codon:yes gene_type:complete